MSRPGPDTIANWYDMLAIDVIVPQSSPRLWQKIVIERLRSETEKALKNPNLVEKFAAQGIEPMPLSPAEFGALIEKEIATNIALVKAAGLKFN